MNKTRMVWLSDGEKSLMMRLAVSIQYRRVTDGRTDKRTSCDSTDRAVHTHHAAKQLQASLGNCRKRSATVLGLMPLGYIYQVAAHCSRARGKLWCPCHHFLPRDATHKRALCRHAVSVRLSVRLSRSWILSKRINISSIFFHFRVATPF